MSKPGRNDPCPCGSGKKYKACCGRDGASQPAAGGGSAAQAAALIQQGLAHHQVGQLDQAEAIYRQVLASAPGNPDALHLLGAAAMQRGLNEQAVELIGKAIRVRPAASMYSNLGNALQALGRSQEAIDSYGKALRLDPNLPDAHNNLGNVQKAAGLLDQAAASFLRAIQIRAEYPEAHCNLASVLHAQGKVAEAVERYQLALRQRFQYAEAHYGLASAQLALGQVAEAIASYRQASALGINEAGLHRALGEALHSQGQHEAAAASLAQAAALEPGNAGTLHLLGLALHAQGKWAEAIASYEAASERAPEWSEPFANLGAAFQAAGDANRAMAAYREALARDPANASAHNNLGLALQGLGRGPEAEACFREAIARNPGLAQAHNNLGVQLQTDGHLPEAEASFREAVARDPTFPEAHCNLGSLMHLTGRYEEAIASCARAIELRPAMTQAHINQGAAYLGLRKAEAAAQSLRRAIQLDPGNAEAHNNLGSALEAQGNFVEAAKHIQHALALNHDFSAAHSNLGNLLMLEGRIDDAVQSYRQALRTAPGLAQPYSNLGVALQSQGLLDEAIAAYRKAVELKPDFYAADNNLLFCMNYHPDLSAGEIYAEYRRWSSTQPREEPGVGALDLEPGRRLRVGYFSPDLRQHAARHFVEPLLAAHDKGQVEVYAYAELAVEDAVSERLRGYVDHWVNTMSMSDDELLERIRADGIDILVDLAGHTAYNRLPLFARRAAPVQVSWLGFGYTTGLDAMDYFLGDPTLTPEGCEELFSEQIVRLPVFAAYRPDPGMGEPSALPAQANGHVTFGTLSRSVRLNHKVIATWSRILERVPGSRLVVNSTDYRSEGMRADLRAKFAAHGIGAERLEIGYDSPAWGVLQRIDISLDCFPHNSGTTLYESLYMGVPYVTLADRPSVGRLGAAILQGVGHPEWIAKDAGDYVDRTVALAGDLPALARLRASLRGEMRASRLMDERAFARCAEDAYRHMWQQWCASPRALVVAARPARAAVVQEQTRRAFELHAQGRLEEALQSCREVALLAPDRAAAHSNLGVILRELGRWQEAEQSLRRAVALDAGFAVAQANLATVLLARRRLSEAAACCEAALLQDPANAQALNNLGVVRKEQGEYREAAELYERAAAADPNLADAYANLGALRTPEGRLDEAAALFERALSIQPNLAIARSNLANVHSMQGDFDAALRLYREAIALDQGATEARGNMLFCLNYHPDLAAGEIFAEYQRWDETMAAPLAAAARPHMNERTAGRRLRVGYVSPDLRRHSASHFIEPLLESHDSRAVEVFAYADVAREDEVSARLRGCVDHWRNTTEVTDEDLAQRIREDRIDILVDLAGHTTGNRLLVFARKPAPVQASWLGFGYTTGLRAMDYFIGDATLTPAGCEHLFSERIARLPAFAPYRPAEGMGEPGPLPAASAGFVRFGTLSRAVRLNDHVIATWAQILVRIPGARLVVNSGDFRTEPMRQRLRERFAAHGIGPERLEIGHESPPWDLYRRIDVSLDCFPHNSGTTLYESLYMGVPYVTLADRPSVGRIGAAILQASGQPQWIATSQAEYVDKAVALATDLQALAAHRASLRATLQASRLMDGRAFAASMEHAFRDMWQHWCTDARGDASRSRG